VLVKPIDGLELLVRMESLLRTRAHLLSLQRERDRAVHELQFLRAQREEYRKARSQSGLDPASSNTATLSRVPGNSETPSETLESREPITSARK
jgi:hypothetical protein